MAKSSVTALTLLDLSATFDTTDHTILLDRLNVYYGLSELALCWFKSYLLGRTHSVKVGSTLSHPAVLHYSIPQGSVLGPILFSLYTNPFGSIIHSHSSINYHFYANDTQLYTTLSPENFSHSIQKLNNCLNNIQNFMFANKLKLNPDKTDFILKGSRKNCNQLLPHFPIFWEIRSSQHKVSGTSEWCSSLFLWLTDFELRRFQLVQNSLCIVVTHSSKFSHITPQLKKLHWLPVRYRVQYKTGLITYKILTQGHPVYLRGLIQPYTSCRNTRRSTPKLKFLQTPTFDRRVHKSIKHFSSFISSHYAPALWNSFPLHVRNSPSVASFRKHLKTHIFSSSFPT